MLLNAIVAGSHLKTKNKDLKNISLQIFILCIVKLKLWSKKMSVFIEFQQLGISNVGNYVH